MAVQNGARGVDDRIVLIVSVGEHGVDPRDRPAAFRRIARAFDQLGDRRKGRWRIPARRSRLAQKDADLARGVGHAGETVQYEEYALALRSQMLGHAGRQHRAAQAQIGGMVGRHRDDRGARRTLPAHIAIDEIGHFARAFADQADDDGIGIRPVNDHVHQHRLAHARSGHDADPLPLAESGQRVQGTDADIHRLGDARPVERVDPVAAGWPGHPGSDRALPVDRAPGPIDRTAEEILAHGQHSGIGFGTDHRTGAQQDRVAEHHHHGVAVAEPDRFRPVPDPAPLRDCAERSDRYAKTRYLDQAPVAGDHAAEAARREVEPAAARAFLQGGFDQGAHEPSASSMARRHCSGPSSTPPSSVSTRNPPRSTLASARKSSAGAT